MANIAKDILLDSNYDLQIVNGDFVVGPSDQQHANLLLNTAIGNWKQFPTIGVFLKQYIAGNINKNALQQIISVALNNDGMTLKSLNVILDTYGQYTFDLDISRNF